MGDMIELPRVRELKASIDDLRQSVAEAIYTKEYLIHVVGREIEMADRLASYDVEIDILEARCRILVLARERERRLAGRTVAGKIAEAQMDEILGQWEGELNRKKTLLAEARAWKARPAAKEEALRGLMMLLIKALHPDLNPEACDEALMEKAADAFRAGDEKALRKLADEAERDEGDSLPGSLLEEEARLKNLRDRYADGIAAIRKGPPFAGVLDAEAREARWKDLIKERGRLEKVREKEEAAFKALFGNTKPKEKKEDDG